MKKSFLSLIFLASIATPALADETTDLIKQEAEKCTKALLAADTDEVVRYSHPRLIEKMGGKEAMVEKFKKGVEDMRAHGVIIEKGTIGEPEKPVKADAWLVSLVPQTLVAKVQGNRVEKQTHIIGISEDGGKKWTFIDVGERSEAQLLEVFPELKGKLKLPEPKKPVVTPAEK